MIKLETYEDWKHCIVEQRRILLTADFIVQRLAVLADRQGWTTQRFIEIWGERHLRQLVAWSARPLGSLCRLARRPAAYPRHLSSITQKSCCPSCPAPASMAGRSLARTVLGEAGCRKNRGHARS